MRQLINWLRTKRTSLAQTNVDETPEWLALKEAMLAHDMVAVYLYLPPWCLLPGSEFAKLKDLANREKLEGPAISKLEILFEYYAKNLDMAFARAQAHLAQYGFDADLHVLSMVSLYQHNQFEDAHAYHLRPSQAEVLSLNRADYWQTVAVIRWANNDMVNLERAADRTLDLTPNDEIVLQLLLGMYIELGAQKKVELVRDRLAGRRIVQGFAHSLSMLAMGEDELGWGQMEDRYVCGDAWRFFNPELKTHTRWKGEPLVGKCLLLSAEQGLGDTIQMARYISMLNALGAQKVLLEVQPEALTLLQHNFPEMPIVERSSTKFPVGIFDCWIGMMSLPLRLKAWGRDIPGRSGYLRVPPENGQYWKERVDQLSSTRRPRIGLAWSGQPYHRADRRRSIPFEQMMRQVRSLPVSFFALQTHVPQVLPANVINVSEEMITLADTAALIEQMDLVITVDTSVVHIAGALGKATWLLLPKRYEWRWGLEGEENDWYDSVKVIRQAEHANWAAVLQNVFEHRLPAQFNL
jgi:hypothetical protein